MITVSRYHDISCGHRVVGHESKCKDMHGHNYRVTFTCTATRLDALGRVIDFGVMKTTLCQWLEDNYDHKFLVWDQDPLLSTLFELPGIIVVPFNPTAENIAESLLTETGPTLLKGTNVTLIKVDVEETRKCSATAEL